MTHLKVLCVGAALAAIVAGYGSRPARAQGIREYIRSWHSEPPTLEDAARRIDHLQSCLANDGSVVVKQPDVWSQARMTKFRKEYENTMALQLTKFSTILSAQIARSDTATFSSQTSLAASLSPITSGGPVQFTATDVPTELGTANTLLGSNLPFPAPGETGFPTASDFTLLNALTPVNGSGAGGKVSDKLQFGLEPNIQNDEQSDYITHLQRLRRINLGDDNADSAGYGLYLVRVPVSITPGDCTKKGFGAVVNMTVSHDFGPRFLPSTYRNLVINDVIDQLSPVVYEMIRSGLADDFHNALKEYKPNKAPNALKSSAGTPSQPEGMEAIHEAGKKLLEDQRMKDKCLRTIAAVARSRTVNRSEPRVYPVAPDDVTRVFGGIYNILNLAYHAQSALGMASGDDAKAINFNTVHLTDIRSYLKQELGAAYDLMEGRCAQDIQPVLADVPYIDDLSDKVACRKFDATKGARSDWSKESHEFIRLYHELAHRLPGNIDDQPMGVLCWAIAIDAGLLNRQLHEDMKETTGADGWRCPPEAEHMPFYQPMPPAEVTQVFEHYVKARWPVITFALEPVIDQQNIDDAFTRRRDLQLALSFALAAGRISFRQAINYTRSLQYEAQTIALNQTVAAFAHGNDTFGWRISPRYQTPPEESNLRAVTNLLLRGGPGPNYQLNNSKIEPGTRELTAIVVMPSFIRGVRFDVANDWYRLVDPDELKVRAAHTIEYGRKINEARDCLESACQNGRYRTEDVQRLRARLHQLEQLLPLQTQFVKVPFENTLGGFDLFTPGASALVPQLTGFYGVDSIDMSPTSPECDLVVYGKHFSIYESHVNVGGKDLPVEGTGIVIATDNTGAPLSVASAITPLRSQGKLQLLSPPGAPIPIDDNGSFDIISREVMRVRIPAELARQLAIVTKADGSKWVEICVSTPNGISNRLQVPVKPTPPPAATAAPTPGYTLAAGTTVNLAYFQSPQNDGSIVVGPNYPDQHSPKKFAITPVPVAIVDPSPVDVTFDFDRTSTIPLESVTVTSVPFDTSSNAYVVKSDDLAVQLQDAAKVLYANAASPKPSIIKAATTKITIKATGGDNDAMPTKPVPGLAILDGTTDNQLAINFVYFPGPPPPAAGAKKGPNVAPPMPLPKGVSRSGDLKPAISSSTPLPASARRDDLTLKTAFQPTPAPPAGSGLTLPLTVSSPAATVSMTANALGVTGSATLPGPATIPSDLSLINAAGGGTFSPQMVALINALAARKAATPTVVVVPPRAPTINVQVPVNNTMNPAKAERHSMFHRRNKQNATPQNPTRPPLMERLRGNP
jgi:hypothetical protein